MKQEKPIPDFDKLFKEAAAKRKAKFFEFLHAMREVYRGKRYSDYNYKEARQ